MPSKLAAEIALVFLSKDYKWAFDNQLKVPNAEDVQGLLDRLVTMIDDEEDDSSVECGRLIVRNSPEGNHEVFVLLGTI